MDIGTLNKNKIIGFMKKNANALRGNPTLPKNETKNVAEKIEKFADCFAEIPGNTLAESLLHLQTKESLYRKINNISNYTRMGCSAEAIAAKFIFQSSVFSAIGAIAFTGATATSLIYQLKANETEELSSKLNEWGYLYAEQLSLDKLTEPASEQEPEPHKNSGL